MAMINSMTAFARIDAPLDKGSLQWEIRSVNHRHLEPQFRLPEAFRDLEIPLRDLVRSRLKRGKVDSTLRLASAASPRLEIDHAALRQLLATLDQLRGHIADVAPASALELLRWPGVLTEPPADTESAKAEVLRTFEVALEALEGHRGREGAMLGTLITTKLTEIEHLVAQLRPVVAGLPGQQRLRLQARLADLAVNVDNDRLEQEVALLAQRSDVTEELDRLDIHVAEARNNLAGPGPHGRHLDFLLQELNREANTLASKSVLAEIAQRSIELKVIIEQIREQAQNIE